MANAIVLKNQDVGTSWNLAFSAERALTSGFWMKTAYSYGESKNTVDPGSIAAGSWTNNQHSGDPNNPGIGYSLGSPGHRWYLAASYTRRYFRWGATTVSGFWESRNGERPVNTGSGSYVFSGDLNNDGSTSNDLIYIPRDASEMNFQTFVASGRTFTGAEQAAAFEAFISGDEYLSKHRGQYVQRNAVFLPLEHRLDFNIAQDLLLNFAGREHRFQFRVDALNFTNLLNSNWGVGNRFVSTSPLIVPTAAQGGVVDAQGRAQYRLRVVNNELITRVNRAHRRYQRRLSRAVQHPVYVSDRRRRTLGCRLQAADGGVGGPAVAALLSLAAANERQPSLRPDRPAARSLQPPA